MGKVNDETMNVLGGQGEPTPGTGARLPVTDDPITAAREFLAATASKVHQDLSPRRLFFYTERYRAHLVTVLAAIESGYVRVPASRTPVG